LYRHFGARRLVADRQLSSELAWLVFLRAQGHADLVDAALPRQYGHIGGSGALRWFGKFLGRLHQTVYLPLDGRDFLGRQVVDPRVARLRQVAYDELAPTVRLPWVESGFVIEPQRQARLGPLARLVLLLPRGQRGAEAAFDEQMVKDVRAMTALAVLVHRGK